MPDCESSSIFLHMTILLIILAIACMMKWPVCLRCSACSPWLCVALPQLSLFTTLLTSPAHRYILTSLLWSHYGSTTRIILLSPCLGLTSSSLYMVHASHYLSRSYSSSPYNLTARLCPLSPWMYLSSYRTCDCSPSRSSWHQSTACCVSLFSHTFFPQLSDCFGFTSSGFTQKGDQHQVLLLLSMHSVWPWRKQ